jgi:hypothetical protein
VKWDSLLWLRLATTVFTVFNLAAYLNARKIRLPKTLPVEKNGHPAKAGQVILECFYVI